MRPMNSAPGMQCILLRYSHLIDEISPYWTNFMHLQMHVSLSVLCDSVEDMPTPLKVGLLL